jgi:hypothetical protein
MANTTPPRAESQQEVIKADLSYTTYTRPKAQSAGLNEVTPFKRLQGKKLTEGDLITFDHVAAGQ